MARLGSLSCFFPAYNEEANLGRLLDEAVETLPRFADRWEIIVVDDGSLDRTADVVRDRMARRPEIRLVPHEHNLGYGLAIRTGLRASTGDAIFFCDADLQFRIADLERLLPAFETADVVVGYRIKRCDPWHRRVIARVYHLALAQMFDLQVRDVDCAFKLFRREVVETVLEDLQSRAAFISPELVIRAQAAGFRVAEVGVGHYPRVAGKPKGAPPKVIARTIQEMVRLRSGLPARTEQATPR